MANRNKHQMVELQLPKKEKGVKNGWQKVSSMTPKKTLLRCTVLLHSLEKRIENRNGTRKKKDNNNR